MKVAEGICPCGAFRFQNLVNFRFWWSYTLIFAPIGVKFCMGSGPILRAKFHPHRCNVSPLRDEKLQNWLLSNLNYYYYYYYYYYY